MLTLAIYLLTVLCLIFFVFIIPGVSLFPRFLFHPRSAATIPFLSISIVVSYQYLVSYFDKFTQLNLILFISILSLIAVYRLHAIFKSYPNLHYSWSKKDFKAILIILFSSIPLMIILGLDGFQHADEIMSWNLWAKKIYLNQQVTFESTGSPYPLLLSSFIAFCYKFIGNIDYQLPIRFTFSLIYISTIFVVFSFVKTKTMTGFFFLSYIIVFLIIGAGYEFKKVYADPLMACFLVSSLALLMSLNEEQKKLNSYISAKSILLASVILVCSAALTKQGAILWTMMIYPLLAYLYINKNQELSKISIIFTTIVLRS